MRTQTIAPLCPFQYGYGVYMARALLSPVDTTVYFGSCEQIDTITSSTSTSHKAHKFKNKNSGGDTTLNISVKVYPNPANTALNIEMELNSGQVAFLELYNSLGQQVLDKKLENNLTTIPIANLTAGIYYFRIIDNNGNLLLSDKQMIVH